MPNDITNFGQFIPTTNIYDVDILNEIDVTSPQFKELLVRLYQTVNNIAIVLNNKDSGYYPLQEFVTGKVLYPTIGNDFENNGRPIYRKEIVVPALPASAAVPVVIPHNIQNITNTFRWITIDGAATNPATIQGLKLPFVGIVLADMIKVTVDAVNVTITSGGTDYSSFTGQILLEYVKY